jgi:hypothetical protein
MAPVARKLKLAREIGSTPTLGNRRQSLEGYGVVISSAMKTISRI